MSHFSNYLKESLEGLTEYSAGLAKRQRMQIDKQYKDIADDMENEMEPEGSEKEPQAEEEVGDRGFVTKFFCYDNNSGGISLRLYDKVEMARRVARNMNAGDYDSPGGGSDGWIVKDIQVRKDVNVLEDRG
jgi:hypothetical protein